MVLWSDSSFIQVETIVFVILKYLKRKRSKREIYSLTEARQGDARQGSIEATIRQSSGVKEWLQGQWLGRELGDSGTEWPGCAALATTTGDRPTFRIRKLRRCSLQQNIALSKQINKSGQLQCVYLCSLGS